MDKTILGQTTFEQMPPQYKSDIHRHAHKPWAIIILVVVGILFGLFWLYEQHAEHAHDHDHDQTALPIVSIREASAHTQSSIDQTSSPDTLSDLEAATVSTPIADHSSLF